MGLTATVLGASGFAGGELLRLLEHHPSLVLGVAAGGSKAGEPIAATHPHLPDRGERFGTLDEALAADSDVCFSCLPHGELAPRAGEIGAGLVVDLSRDHRGASGWAYGLTEHHREAVRGASRIANPGCYPTAALLALIPFATAGLIEAPVVVDAISGVSGAGRRAVDELSFSVASGGVRAYGDAAHPHRGEIESGLSDLGALEAPVSFTPHLAPMARGLLVTARARAKTSMDDGAAIEVLEAAYSREPFVSVARGWPETKAVAGSNHAHVSARVDARGGWLIASAAIDNLGKGAAGQAVQNANVALGLEETAGLEALGVWP